MKDLRTAGPEDDPFYRLAESERAAVLAACAAVLKPTHQFVLRLKYGMGLTNAEIAARSAVGERAISKMLKQSIMPAMRKELERRGITEMRQI